MTCIVIAEDESSLQEIYTSVLTLSGYNVRVKDNGLDIVEYVKITPEKPDIIIMDYRMPLKNGLEASKEILDIDPSIRIIFASADISIREEALSIGVMSFKSKPFSMKKLIRNIEKALNTKEVTI